MSPFFKSICQKKNKIHVWTLSESRCWMELHFSHVVDVVAAVVVVAVVDVTAVVTIHGGRQIIRESPFSSTMYYFCIATISCWTKFALLLKQFFPVRSLPRTELSLGMLMPHPKVRERAFSLLQSNVQLRRRSRNGKRNANGESLPGCVLFILPYSN